MTADKSDSLNAKVTIDPCSSPFHLPQYLCFRELILHKFCFVFHLPSYAKGLKVLFQNFSASDSAFFKRFQ